MSLIEAKIRIKKTARYYILKDEKTSISQLWFVCHGYGQLAEDFIEFFNPLVNSQFGVQVVAPEGLSRLYLKGFAGQVGASWMTKMDRENEIADYCDYLSCVYKEVVESLGAEIQPQVNILGFSQGSETVCRWVVKNKIRFNNLILYSGKWPEEYEMALLTKISENFKVVLVYGDRDKIFSEEHFSYQLKAFEDSGIKVMSLSYQGGHELSSSVVEQIYKKIYSVT